LKESLSQDVIDHVMEASEN